MQVILIRHGESEANAFNGDGYKMFTGQFDCPLTAHGRAQAEALRGSAIFAGAEKFFVSDLLRARETAAPFADPALTVYDRRLRERSLGEFEGHSVDEIMADPRYGKYFTDPAYKNFRADFIVRAPKGENYTDVSARIREFWNEVKAGGFSKVVIVSHICALSCLMKEICGLSEEETLRLRIATCDPMILEA